MEEKTRTDIEQELRRELEHTVETDILIDRLWDRWEVIDMLAQEFGEDRARSLISAPALFIREREEIPL